MHIGPIVRVLAAWLTIAALGAPAANARPADMGAPRVTNHEGPPTAVTVARSGFDWAAAGIGAGVILSSSPRRLAAQLPLARELAAVRSLSAIRR
jgi:hypothetical protein